MTFRTEYAEQAITHLTHHIRKEAKNGDFWEAKLHVGKKWHFRIAYAPFSSREIITVTYHTRDLQLRFENGELVRNEGLRRFDMLFAALHGTLIPLLENGKTRKITHKKLNERHLLHSPYFWAKIDYYLHKKESQEVLYALFGDEKYRKRAVRIQRAIDGYMEDKQNFFEKTKLSVHSSN